MKKTPVKIKIISTRRGEPTPVEEDEIEIIDAVVKAEIEAEEEHEGNSSGG